jgi:hypothetical protein
MLCCKLRKYKTNLSAGESGEGPLASAFNEGRHESPVRFIANEAFIPLIKSVMHERHLTNVGLARLTAMSQAKLSRCLAGKRPLDRITIQTIFHVLDVDVLKAQFAVGHLGDWGRYYDPDIEVIAGLVAHLPDSLARARGASERVPLSSAALAKLADHLCSIIAKNDEAVVRRRDELEYFEFGHRQRDSG